MALIEKSKTVVAQRWLIKAITGNGLFVVNGDIVAPGSIVEMNCDDAQSLILRRKAVDATEAEISAAGSSIIVAPGGSDKWADAT